jgi:hypothetical protein
VSETGQERVESGTQQANKKKEPNKNLSINTNICNCAERWVAGMDLNRICLERETRLRRMQKGKAEAERTV